MFMSEPVCPGRAIFRLGGSYWMGVRRLGRQRPQIHERRGALHRGSIRQVQWSSFGLYMRSRRGWIGLLDQHTHVAQQQIVLEYIAVEEAPGQSLESLRVHNVHLWSADHLFADSRSQIHSVRKLQRGIQVLT
jgi:hypothetical protein